MFLFMNAYERCEPSDGPPLLVWMWVQRWQTPTVADDEVAVFRQPEGMSTIPRWRWTESSGPGFLETEPRSGDSFHALEEGYQWWKWMTLNRHPLLG